jgi:RimJ/RimL family protein N-acetyltransferase
MIIGQHTVIRSAEPDDAIALWRLYDPDRPRAFLLGPAREVLIPTIDELREMLGRRDVVQGTFFVIEDTVGEVRGCCVLRGARLESEFAEIVIVFGSDDYYASPPAEEVFRFLARSAFIDKKLNKMCAHCLSAEESYRAFLIRHGFNSDGVQRDMVYTKGRYFDLESLSLFQQDVHLEDLRGSNGIAVTAS